MTPWDWSLFLLFPWISELHLNFWATQKWGQWCCPLRKPHWICCWLPSTEHSLPHMASVMTFNSKMVLSRDDTRGEMEPKKNGCHPPFQTLQVGHLPHCVCKWLYSPSPADVMREIPSTAPIWKASACGMLLSYTIGLCVGHGLGLFYLHTATSNNQRWTLPLITLSQGLLFP